MSHGAVVASTLPAVATRGLSASMLAVLGSNDDSLLLGGEHYAVKLLFRHGSAAVYALDSIDSSAAPLVAAALRATLLIALGALALVAVASLWLARTVARPIDTLSRSLTAMTQSHDYGTPIAPTGSSLEVDALTATFNTMMASVLSAEADTRSAYVGAIRALALALDARDPYTAGHSERVSAISVAIGHQMHLPEAELDILRLGALLHDIGKIGISDDVLRKPGALTDEEFEAIKEHPVTGARILRTVPFLAERLPIVELHHERPDGKGYPHGLRGDEIPRLARIVTWPTRSTPSPAPVPTGPRGAPAMRCRSSGATPARSSMPRRCRRSPAAFQRCGCRTARSTTRRPAPPGERRSSRSHAHDDARCRGDRSPARRCADGEGPGTIDRSSVRRDRRRRVDVLQLVAAVGGARRNGHDSHGRANGWSGPPLGVAAP